MSDQAKMIKRYDIYDRIAVGEISEGVDGDYVTYSDHLAEIEQLKDELARYKNGTQIKEIHYDEPTPYIAEIAALKARLLGFEGRTYSENQQLDKLMEIIQMQNKSFKEIYSDGSYKDIASEISIRAILEADKMLKELND